MLSTRFMDYGRAIAAATLTVTIASSAIAQTTPRISRTDGSYDLLDRRLQSNEIGGLDDLNRSRSIFDTNRPVDVSKVDKTKLANLMAEAISESARLYNSMYNDYSRNTSLRPLLQELQQLQAQTKRLSEDIKAGTKLEYILTDFRELDADWRVFSHRATQANGLSSATKQSLGRIDTIDKEVGKLFQVEPTLDRRALLRELATLENSLYNLAGELEREVSTSTTSLQLANTVRKLQQQVARSEDMILDNYPYDRIVTEHNRFERSWETILSQLGTISNRYIEQAVRRIVEADNRIHELLWLDNSASRTQLKQTADALIRDVDEFYSRTPLKLLLAFKDATTTLRLADEFYGTVQNFKDNLASNASDQQLIESYGYVEQYGLDFVRTFRKIKSQQGIVVLNEIEDGLAAIRSELHLGGTVADVDTRRLTPIAASLENLADQLDMDVRQWLNTERPAFRTEAATASSNFRKRTQRLHAMMDAEPTLQELQKETDELYRDWLVLYDFLGRSRSSSDRAILSQVAREIMADLTDLNSSLRL